MFKSKVFVLFRDSFLFLCCSFVCTVVFVSSCNSQSRDSLGTLYLDVKSIPSEFDPYSSDKTKIFMSPGDSSLSELQYYWEQDWMVLRIPGNILSSHIKEREANNEGRLQNMLSLFDSSLFGVKPEVGSILNENDLHGFNTVSWPQLEAGIHVLFYDCSNEQKKRLIKGIVEKVGHIVKTYLEFSQSDIDEENVELYFNNVFERLFALANTLSIMDTKKPISPESQYKIIAMELIKKSNIVYTYDYRENTHDDVQKEKIAKHDQKCRDIIVNLINLMSDEFYLNASECNELVRHLDSAVPVKHLLLMELNYRGLQLMKDFCKVFGQLNLDRIVEMLEKLDVKQLRQCELVYYVATLYCLSNLDDLQFTMYAYDGSVEIKKRARNLSKEKLKQLYLE